MRSAGLLQAAARAAVHRRNSICATLAALLYALDSAQPGRDFRLDTSLHEARQRGVGTSKVSLQWPVHPYGPFADWSFPDIAGTTFGLGSFVDSEQLYAHVSMFYEDHHWHQDRLICQYGDSGLC